MRVDDFGLDAGLRGRGQRRQGRERPDDRHVVLQFGDLRESYGFTLRVRSDTKIMAAAGVNWRPGAVRVHYDLLGGW